MSYLVFADGSSLGNPGPGGWGAIVSSSLLVRELGGGETHTTNNRMELTAVIEALKSLPKNSHVTLCVDSQYVLKGATLWLKSWQKNNWQTSQKKSVLNRDLWEELHRELSRVSVSWKYIPAHVGILGNERVDTIAKAFAGKEKISLFSGKREHYTVSLEHKTKEGVFKKSSSKKPFAYVSLVDGSFTTHNTWASCEKTVRGKAYAKYKKVFSQKELDSTRKSWMSR